MIWRAKIGINQQYEVDFSKKTCIIYFFFVFLPPQPDESMIKNVLKVLLTVVMVLAAPLNIIGQTLSTREYTKEHPLVYEDAWDLWPYVFLNEHGEPVGFNIDLLKELFQDLGIPYVIKLKSTADALTDMKEGRSDLMMRLAATFHDDYGKYGNEVVQLFTHSVVSPKSKPVVIHTEEDLGRYKVIVHAGSLSHRMMVDHGWENNCVPLGDMKEAIQRVSSQEEGQIVWNTLSLKWLMNKFQTKTLQLTPIDMPHGEYKFMSNDTVLLHKLDSAYIRLCATDRLQPILNKWFYPERVDSGIPDWVAYVAAAIALLAFLMGYYVVTLRVREKQMTRLIDKHNRRLALILRTTKVRVWLYDIQRRVFVWMNANGEMDNQELTEEEFGKSICESQFEALKQELAEIAGKHKENSVIPITSYEEQGNREYMMSLSVFRRIKNDIPTIIVGIMDDQTEQLKGQRKAKDNLLRYQSIFSTSMVDMTYYNPEGIMTDINQKACDTFKCSREEILAEGVPFTHALEDPSQTADSFEGSYSTHIIKGANNPNLAKSIVFSSDIYYEQQLIPMYDASNRFLGIFGSGRDVSEFVNSYHEQKKRVEMLTSAAFDITEYINNINYALHVGGVRLANYSPYSHTLTIFKEMNVVQLKLTQSRCLALVDEQSKRTAIRLLNNMDMKSEETVDVEIKTIIRIPGNQQLVVQLHFIPIYNSSGVIDNYFGLCRDISQMKATEEKLVFEKSKAQELENVKNVFLRNMSHEIRTPITTVVGFAELFVEDHDEADEDGFITEIKNNAKFLLKLVNDILFLSRLDAHMIEFNRSPIDFAYTFEGHCQMGWAAHMKNGVNYIVENPYEHLIIDIDDANVGHIIEQIAENAARYTTSGIVRTRYDYIGDRLLIAIDDTGVGIDSDKQQHLFERFCSSGEGSGTGLGLPICKELAQQMGGAIYINSAAGQGTTVWIVMPCQATLIEKKLITN